MKKKSLQILLVLTALFLLFIAGPRERVHNVSLIPAIPDDVENYLSLSEAKFTNLTPGSEKKIFWANPEHTKTPLAIVYLHGFSATRQEISPIPEHLAQELHANLFLTRLTGHGIANPEALRKVHVSDWLSDALEALEIGHKLGKQVVLIATSTGGALAIWLASQHPDIHALILVSPNFSIADPRSKLVLLPWGRGIARLILGKYREWKPKSTLEKKYWTYRYRSQAVVPVIALSDYVSKTTHPEEMDIPLQIFYCPKDIVISVPAVKAFYAKYHGTNKNIIAVTNAHEHVLTGNIISPQTVDEVYSDMLHFLRP